MNRIYTESCIEFESIENQQIFSTYIYLWFAYVTDSSNVRSPKMSQMSKHLEDPIQIIQAESVDQQKLIRLLKETYGESEGKNNFRVEVYTAL